MKWVSRILITAGILLLVYFGYALYDNTASQNRALAEAEKVLTSKREVYAKETADLTEELPPIPEFHAEYGEVIGVLDIPKLDRQIGISEGADDYTMKGGVGHISSTVFPGQREQIVLSGHRETVFRDFADLEIGDKFIVEMPYGSYEYEIKNFKIVDADDRTVIKKMGEEVLVVSTCYPFTYIGPAPQRYVVYAYPVLE